MSADLKVHETMYPMFDEKTGTINEFKIQTINRMEKYILLYFEMDKLNDDIETQKDTRR